VTTVEVFLRRHAEILLVLTILFVVVVVFHLVPFKLAFLHFFYLPILVAGYLLGKRRTVYCSLLCVLIVLIYFFWEWTREALVSGQGWSAMLNVALQNWNTLMWLATWGGFLILTGAAFGHIHERMQSAYEDVQRLNEELRGQARELREVNQALQASTNELREQAEQLQEKNLVIEKLRQDVEQTLYSTMDATVARLMIQDRLREEKRNISVLFCDLIGFARHAHVRPPEVILEDLNRFYGAMEEVTEAYHGHVDKYLGDGIMCEFGAPVVHEQHALQAVVAGLKMQDRFKRLQLPFELRVGLASGEAVVGLLGSRRRSYSALGDVVNLAKRLEEICEPGSVFMDENTRRHVHPFLKIERVRSFPGRRAGDKQVLDEIDEKERQLVQDPMNPELLFVLGKLCFRVFEASRALEFLRRALQLRPDDNEIKLAYADATVKRDEYEKIAIRGLAERQAVFKAVCLVDPLEDRSRFPRRFTDQYRAAREWLEIPEDIALPTEVIDGTVGHSLSVAVLSYGLADQLGLPEAVKRDVLTAAQLQDVGKAVVWHHVLNRPGSLSDQERKDLVAHVAESVAGAKRIGYGRPGVIEVIANHHELLNGTGYPRGIKGEDIPLGARISCVADVYCALTARRPYREPWDSHAALSELRKGAAAGKYDARIVDAVGVLVG
jgi:HD-GYP domain-containing protein (c-di-GMP phosphodiesterase class II)